MNKTMLNRRGESSIFGRPVRMQTRLFMTITGVAFAFIAVFFFVRYTTRQRIEETFYGEVVAPQKDAYDFHLIDQDGKPFHLSQLRGKAVLFSFGYTHCPDVCPTTLTEFTNIYQAMPQKDRNKMQTLFISVDPERDHPETLKEYISYFDPSFLGLTGSVDQIKEAAAAYGAAYTTIHPRGEASNVYFVNHSSFAYLISPNGQWKLRYLFEQLRNTEKVAADIERLVADGSR